MTVAQLIERLKTMPQESVVWTKNYDGCWECNEEGMPIYHVIEDVDFETRGQYPSYQERDLVVLS
jgi:hypothetical protein